MYIPTAYEFAGFLLLAQEGGGAQGVAPADPDPGKADGGGGFGLGPLMLPILMVLAVYMFLMIIPGRREQKKAKELMESLKKNDRVLTSAGIKGTIVNISKDTPWATIRIDEANNTKMQVLRSSISRVLTGDDKEEVESSEKK